MYDYKATILAIHDGDTVTLNVDLGFSIFHTDHFRLYGINAPELSAQAGKDALAFIETLIKVGDTVEVKTYKSSSVNPADLQGKYGRYLATLVTTDGTNVNDTMVKSGHAVAYFGGKR